VVTGSALAADADADAIAEAAGGSAGATTAATGAGSAAFLATFSFLAGTVFAATGAGAAATGAGAGTVFAGADSFLVATFLTTDLFAELIVLLPVEVFIVFKRTNCYNEMFRHQIFIKL
jgi:hypothetical protein